MDVLFGFILVGSVFGIGFLIIGIYMIFDKTNPKKIPMPPIHLKMDNFCNVCNLPTDGVRCYSKRCPV